MLDNFDLVAEAGLALLAFVLITMFEVHVVRRWRRQPDVVNEISMPEAQRASAFGFKLYTHDLRKLRDTVQGDIASIYEVSEPRLNWFERVAVWTQNADRPMVRLKAALAAAFYLVLGLYILVCLRQVLDYIVFSHKSPDFQQSLSRMVPSSSAAMLAAGLLGLLMGLVVVSAMLAAVETRRIRAWRDWETQQQSLPVLERALGLIEDQLAENRKDWLAVKDCDPFE